MRVSANYWDDRLFQYSTSQSSSSSSLPSAIIHHHHLSSSSAIIIRHQHDIRRLPGHIQLRSRPYTTYYSAEQCQFRIVKLQNRDSPLMIVIMRICLEALIIFDERSRSFSKSLFGICRGILVEKVSELLLVLLTIFSFIFVMSRVSCQKGPICHAQAWRVGPFWQDSIDVWNRVRSTEPFWFGRSTEYLYSPLSPPSQSKLAT